MATSASRPIRFAVRGPIERADLPGLSERVCALFEEHANCVVECDVGGVPPDAVTVEALARLQLVAHRNRCQVRLCNASTDLLEVVALMGLTDVLAE
jgi:ABC-type transporter Mla MlaB component